MKGSGCWTILNGIFIDFTVKENFKISLCTIQKKMVLFRAINKSRQAIDMLILKPMSEIYSAMPVEVRTKTTCKFLSLEEKELMKVSSIWRKSKP